MKFGLVKEVSSDLYTRFKEITQISENLEKKFSKKDYGAVKSCIISVNCVNPNLLSYNEDFETGEVIYKKYTKSKEYLTFTVKLNYANVEKVNERRIELIIKEALNKACPEIKKLKIPNFNIDGFFSDLEGFFDNEDGTITESEVIEKKEDETEFINKELSFKEVELDKNEFWNLIEKSIIAEGYNVSNQVSFLIALLSKRNEKKIIGFECTLRNLIKEAYHYNVMAVQKILGGYLSDDSFLYFRCKLILNGRSTFEKAIKNPNELNEDIELFPLGEPLLMVADNAFILKYGENTHKELPTDFASEFIDYNIEDYEMKGEVWQNEDELQKLFPHLWGRYK